MDTNCINFLMLHHLLRPSPPPLAKYNSIARTWPGTSKISCFLDGYDRHYLSQSSHKWFHPRPRQNCGTLYRALLSTSLSNFSWHSLKLKNRVDAMQSEFNALLQNNTWTLVPSSPDQHVIGFKWVGQTKSRWIYRTIQGSSSCKRIISRRRCWFSARSFALRLFGLSLRLRWRFMGQFINWMCKTRFYMAILLQRSTWVNRPALSMLPGPLPSLEITLRSQAITEGLVPKTELGLGEFRF